MAVTTLPFAEFEASVTAALSESESYSTRMHADVWMRMLKLVRPDIHAMIADRHIDPMRHASKLPKARLYAEANW